MPHHFFLAANGDFFERYKYRVQGGPTGFNTGNRSIIHDILEMPYYIKIKIDLSNSQKTTSISEVKFSWTTLYTIPNLSGDNQIQLSGGTKICRTLKNHKATKGTGMRNIKEKERETH